MYKVCGLVRGSTATSSVNNHCYLLGKLNVYHMNFYKQVFSIICLDDAVKTQRSHPIKPHHTVCEDVQVAGWSRPPCYNISQVYLCITCYLHVCGMKILPIDIWKLRFRRHLYGNVCAVDRSDYIRKFGKAAIAANCILMFAWSTTSFGNLKYLTDMLMTAFP